MVALLCLWFLSLAPLFVFGSPVQSLAARQSSVRGRKPISFTINTPIGLAHGIQITNNVARFTVKYGTATRFQPSSPTSSWTSLGDVTALPPVCLQPTDPTDPNNSFIGVEDCLYAVFYVPMNQKVVQSGLPVILWVHGGSFIAGSASDPALDGTSLAASTNSIVAVVQYRLGALGFLPPISLNSNTNLGAKDVVTALKFISNVVSSFGGTPGLVTLAGQSSGATLIRGLLGAPSAQSYFKNAWLHSDPFDYGFNNPGAQQNLQSAFYGGVSCESSSKTCALAMSLQSIIASQNQVFLNGPSIDPSTGASMPIRVVHDGSFITSTLTQQSFPSSLKPIIVTTANKDAGPVIFGGAPPLPPSLYTDVLEGTFSDQDTQTLENSGFYDPPTDPDADIRPELVILGTDQVWRCPTWTMSRTWSSRGGTIFTGLWVLGATYPTNTGFDICTTPGNVCHQDDIEIVFGTVANPTPAQAALVQEVQARYGAFVRTSNPNPSGFAKWTASSPSNINAINLGGSGTAATGGCIPSLWGNQVLYYYQQFGQ